MECEPSPKVSWYHNSKEIISTSRINISFDVTTRVTTLTIQNVTKPDEGDYVCRATNPLGEGTTRTVLHIKGTYVFLVPAYCSLLCFGLWDSLSTLEVESLLLKAKTIHQLTVNFQLISLELVVYTNQFETI